MSVFFFKLEYKRYSVVLVSAARKWNLSDLDGEIFDEELTDSEQVELDMMKLTGNQLNYMV